MAVYSGKTKNALDFIAASGGLQSEILKIYEEICPTQIGELRMQCDIENSTCDNDLPGLKYEQDVQAWYYDDIQYFNGWVYPNGDKFSAESFPEAAEIFGELDGFFTVPDLTDRFFKGSSDGVQSINIKTDISSHNHPITDTQGITTVMTIPNGMVICASGAFGKTKKVKYYTHPATVKDVDWNKTHTDCSVTYYTGADVGAHPCTKNWGVYPEGHISAGMPIEPNYDPENPSKKYIVPGIHSGITDDGKRENDVPLPLDITLKIKDIAAWFTGGETDKEVQPSGWVPCQTEEFVPKNVSIPVMIYIGKKGNPGSN